MATVQIALGGAMSYGAPVAAPVPRASETLTSSASNQESALTAQSGDYCIVTSSGGDIYVAVGTSPDATADPRHMVLSGSKLELGILRDGDKVSIVDV